MAIRKALEHKELVEENRRLADGHRRQADELERYRTDLEILIKVITEDIQAPLKAILRPSRSMEDGHEDIVVDSEDRELADRAIEGLARAARLASDLRGHCREGMPAIAAGQVVDGGG